MFLLFAHVTIFAAAAAPGAAMVHFLLGVLVHIASLRLFFITALFLALAASAQARKHETGFLDRTVSLQGAAFKYQVFVPDDWSPRQKWPIILFLHGAGERGSDGLIQTEVGIGEAIRKGRARFPAIIVMPQCAKDNWWTTPKMEDVALASLAAATKEFKGDPSRTYLTGISMGGYGTWDIAMHHPNTFAAIVPVCGGITASPSLKQKYPELAKKAYADEPKSYAEVAGKIGKTPVWIFHGADDPTVSPENSRKMFAALKAEDGNVHYTEYPGIGHESWHKAYAEPELMTWLLAQKLL
jgi:predicted peptidase